MMRLETRRHAHACSREGKSGPVRKWGSEHTRVGKSLREVLGRLRLAGTRGALGRAAERQLQRRHERAVAAVGQLRHDEAERVAEVLPAVLGRRGDDLDVELGRHVRLVVVAQLAHPVEVVGRLAPRVGHQREHVAPVHVERHHRAERGALQLGEVGAHEAHHVVQLLRALGLVLLEALEAARVERHLRLARPVDLVDREHDHARPVEHPRRARLGGVGLVRLGADARDRLLHHALDLQQPLLDHAVGGLRVERLAEGDALAFDGEHGGDEQLLGEVELRDALEALLEVRLHAERVLGLGENL